MQSSVSPPGKSPSIFKHLVLAVLAFVLFFVWKSLPMNAGWWDNTIVRYLDDSKKQKANLKNMDYRRYERHLYNYQIPMYMLEHADFEKDIFLAPPADYLYAKLGNNPFSTHFADQRWMYYYTERPLKMVGVEDSLAGSATWTVVVAAPNDVRVVKLASAADVEKVKSIFKSI